MLGQLVKNVKIEGIDSRGNPFGRFSGGTILVDKAVPGDRLDVQALRLTKGPDAVYSGRILQILEPSPQRIEAFCKHFLHCGGCQWQNLRYPDQLALKHGWMASLFDRHLPEGASTPLPVASPRERQYRNKIVFNFSNRRWMTPQEKAEPGTILRPAAGYMMQGKYDHALEIHECDIAPPSAISLLHFVRDLALTEGISFYDVRKEQGILRQMMVRYGMNGERESERESESILVRWVLGKYDERVLRLLTEKVTERFPDVKSISYVINPEKDGMVNDLDTVHLWGEASLPVVLNGLTFSMSPGSFFQTNHLQTEQLYQKAIDWCALDGSQRVMDFYSGTGTLALLAARHSRSVLGIEFGDDAVQQAFRNAEVNGISNAHFLAGDLKDMLRTDHVHSFGKPDVVITDPPRSGHHRDVNQVLLELLPDRIVYISCNPRTQERDVRILSSHYRLEKVQPFDMFPQTGHIENLALLTRK